MKNPLHTGLLAAIVGFFSAGIGIGGGAILVPGLMRLGGYDFRQAGSLSLAAIAPITLVGGFTHWMFLKDHFPYLSFLLFILAGSIGVLIGGSSVCRVPLRWLTAAFSLFLLVVGIKMLTGWNLAALSVRAVSHAFVSRPFISLAVFGMIVGAASSLLGVGGGLIIVPFCVYAAEFNIHTAITFSLITMFLLTSAGAFDRYRRKMLDTAAAVRLIPLALLGAAAGAAVSSRLPEPMLRSLFGAFLIAMGLKYLSEEVRRFTAVPAAR